MQLPEIDDNELQLLKYLYKFYYLNTNQLHSLISHVDIRTIQRRLKKLSDTTYLIPHEFNRKQFTTNTKPTIYSLSKLARKRLKTEKDCDIQVLNRVYQEKRVSRQMMYQHIFLADIFLNLQQQLKKSETLHFSTKANLHEFNYFPQPLPDAYIAIANSKKKTQRYFLFLFTIYIPWRVLKNRLEEYIYYSENSKWSDATDELMPTFLIVCLNEKLKKRVSDLIGGSLPKALFYITTKPSIIKSGFNGDGWKKVE